jgi:hypothetical protein
MNGPNGCACSACSELRREEVAEIRRRYQEPPSPPPLVVDDDKKAKTKEEEEEDETDLKASVSGVDDEDKKAKEEEEDGTDLKASVSGLDGATQKAKEEQEEEAVQTIPVMLDWSECWTERTKDVLQRDDRLATLVRTMIRDPRVPEAVVAADELRLHYPHLLEYPDNDKTRGQLPETPDGSVGEIPKGYTYLPDLALVTSEVFCLHTLHIIPELCIRVQDKSRPLLENIERQMSNVKDSMRKYKAEKKVIKKRGTGMTMEEQATMRDKKKVIKALRQDIEKRQHAIYSDEQRARDYIVDALRFWPRVYRKVLAHSAMTMPRTTCNAILCRYGNLFFFYF